jgi:hypothetical protein
MTWLVCHAEPCGPYHNPLKRSSAWSIYQIRWLSIERTQADTSTGQYLAPHYLHCATPGFEQSFLWKNDGVRDAKAAALPTELFSGRGTLSQSTCHNQDKIPCAAWHSNLKPQIMRTESSQGYDAARTVRPIFTCGQKYIGSF